MKGLTSLANLRVCDSDALIIGIGAPPSNGYPTT
jgi:hypothetical protein